MTASKIADTPLDGALEPRRKRWLRALGRRRSARRMLVLSLPVMLVVLADASCRGGRMLELPLRYWGSYAAAVVESALLWGVLLVASSARRGTARWLAAAAFVTLATAAVGTQLYFYESYSTYLNLDATLFGTSLADSLFGQLSADGMNFVASVLPPLLIAIALVWLGRQLLRPTRRTANLAALAVPAAVFGVLAIPCSYRAIQGSTPDVIYFHAIGGLLKQLTGFEQRVQVRPMRRTPPALPPLRASLDRPRNVLLILTESVRADVACASPTPRCPVMPFTNRALPQRIGFDQMRSNSSTTAIQLAVLWSGLEPVAGREALHHAPFLFDYAHAAGMETAYWSSHHMLFANSRLFVQDLPTRFQCGATNLDPLADVDLGADDRLLTERVIGELSQLKEPFFAVAHYGNTHIPYWIDEADAPFAPSLASKAEADNEAYRNHYKNAVHRQDQTVARLIEQVRGLPISERTVIVYTADHGEQFREHGQLGHTGSVFDVEVHVPAWLDAPPGAIDDAQREALASYRSAPTFHTDLMATMMDLMGLWDAPELAAFREPMVGGSLLRPARPERTMALSNCSGVWGCAFENWGVMRGTRKLIAREWDREWLCYDVRDDPEELKPLPLDSCQDLREQADRRFPRLPGRD